MPFSLRVRVLFLHVHMLERRGYREYYDGENNAVLMRNNTARTVRNRKLSRCAECPEVVVIE